MVRNKVCLAAQPGILVDHLAKVPKALWTLLYGQPLTVAEAVKTMSDAITAANMINNALFMRDMGETLSALQARRDYQGEIAHLRAWLELYERQKAVLAAAAQEAVRIAKDDQAKYERQIAKLQRENQELRSQNAELAAGKKAAEDLAQDRGMQLVHWRLYGTERPADRA